MTHPASSPSRSVADLPKAHLHLHFTGSMRVGTVRELAAQHGIRLPSSLTTDWPPRADVEVDDLAPRLGRVFASILDHDSGCHSYGVSAGSDRWFLKGSVTEAAVPLLRNAVSVHTHITHPAIVPLHSVIETPNGLVLVYPWVDGEVLYAGHGRAARHQAIGTVHPGSRLDARRAPRA